MNRPPSSGRAFRPARLAVLLAAALAGPWAVCALAASPPFPGGGRPKVVRRSVRPPERVTQLMVRFREPSMAAAASIGRSRLSGLASRAGLSRLTHARPMSGGLQVLELPGAVSGDEAEAIARRLEADPGVLSASPSRRVYPAFTPDEPGWFFIFPNHWSLSTCPTCKGTANSELAWDLTQGVASTVVAILDTGSTTHSEFTGRTIQGRDMISDADAANDGGGRDTNPADRGDFITAAEDSNCPSGEFCGCCSGDGSGLACDSSWHGTHVSGIIGATGDNGNGVMGMDWNASLMHVRVLGKCGGTETDIIDAIRWAAGLPVSGSPTNANPAKVINMSLSGNDACSPEMQDAIDDAIAAGALVVVAAGNFSEPAAAWFPGNCSGVLTVAAVGPLGEKASYTNSGSPVALAAPGGDFALPSEFGVWSTLNDGTTTPGSEDYAEYQGTSMAAPHVSGTAALMLAANPKADPSTLKAHLISTARAFPTSTGGTDCDSSCGSGIVDAFAAVSTAATPGPSFNLTATTLSQSTIRYNWTPDPASTIDDFRIRNAVTGSLVATTASTQYDRTGQAPNTVVSLRVHARRSLGSGNFEGAAAVFQSTATLSPPVGFSTIVPHITSITVTHPVCAGSACAGYSLMASTAPDFSGQTFVAASALATNTQLTVTGLAGNGVYYLALSSLNDMGGPNPTVYGATVLTNTSLAPPIITETSETGDTQMRLTWVSGGNPPGVTYEAQAATDQGFTTGLVTLTGPTPNVFTRLFTGLSVNTSYFFRVRGLPNGPYSGFLGPVSTLARVPAAAGAPFALLQSDSLRPDWTAGGNPAGTHYFAELSPAADFSLGVQSVLTDNTFADFGGLAKNTPYHARVRAVGHGGQDTAWLTVGSTYTLANTPSSLDFTAQAQDGFTGTFSSNGNAAGTVFVAQISPNASFTPVSASVHTTGNSASFSGLTGNQQYFFRVSALNSPGALSPFAAAASTYTLPFPPTAVSPFGSAQTVSAFRALWGAGNNGSSVYQVQISPAEDFSSGVVSQVTAATFYDFGALSANTRYHLRVRTVASGPGNPPSAFITPGAVSTLAVPPAPSGGDDFLPVTYTSATAQWTALPSSPQSATCEGYRVQASTDPGFGGLLLSKDFSGSATSVGGVAGLAFGTTYWLRVGSLNWDGVPNYLVIGSTRTLDPNLVVATVTASGLVLTLVPVYPPNSPITLIRVVIPAGVLPPGTPVSLNSSVEFDLTPAVTNQAATSDLGAPGIGFFLSAGGVQPAGEVLAFLTYDPLLLPVGSDPKAVALARFDELGGQWSLLPTQVDTTQRVIAGKIGHFSLFTPFFVAAAQDLSHPNIFPIPWQPGSEDPRFNAAQLTITNIPASSRIRIFTIHGELLWEESAGATGVATWNGKNRFGREVASGTYLAVIEGGGGREVRRVVVVR